MPNTERLHDQIADAEKEMKRIQDDAADLLKAVEALVSGYGVKYPNADARSLTEDFASRLDDIVNDLQAPAENRKMRLEDIVSAIEWRDLRRNTNQWGL